MQPAATKLNTKRHERAAQLVADDELSDEKIAETLGIGRSTLDRWKSDPLFKKRVEEITTAYAERALEHGLAVKEKRISIMNEMHAKLLRIIAARAADPEIQKIPGGETGLVVRTIKGIGKGEDYQVVEFFEVDTMTVREIRAIHENVAEEVGQKIERSQTDVTIGELTSAKQRLLAKLCGPYTPDPSAKSPLAADNVDADPAKRP